MNRILAPPPAVSHDLPLRDPLQAMWEDRWMLLAAHGKADWLQRHGLHLLDAPRTAMGPLQRALRRLRDEWTDLPFSDLQLIPVPMPGAAIR